MNKRKNQGYGNALKRCQEEGFRKILIYRVKVLRLIDQLVLKKN